jgi:hypothetical protein
LKEEKKIPISEKVKFWEEQDRINQAVIPRIIEMNEALNRLMVLVSQFDDKIAASESRLKDEIGNGNSRGCTRSYVSWIAIVLSCIAIVISILKAV